MPKISCSWQVYLKYEPQKKKTTLFYDADFFLAYATHQLVKRMTCHFDPPPPDYFISLS